MEKYIRYICVILFARHLDLIYELATVLMCPLCNAVDPKRFLKEALALVSAFFGHDKNKCSECLVSVS